MRSAIRWFKCKLKPPKKEVKRKVEMRKVKYWTVLVKRNQYMSVKEEKLLSNVQIVIFLPKVPARYIRT